MAVHIWPDTSETLTGSIDSLDQDDNSRTITATTFKDSALHFEVASVGGSFDGMLNKEESAIAGTWLRQGVSTKPLVIERTGKYETSGIQAE